MRCYRIVSLLAAPCALACLACAHPGHRSTSVPPVISLTPTNSICYSFDEDVPGKPPKNFLPALTAGGGPILWEVVKTKDAPSADHVVAQLSEDPTNTRYPLLILNDLSSRDVDVSVKFRAVAGQVDQAAGLVWRWQDKNNYLVVRANALENNVVAYQMVAGVRTCIGTKGNSEAYGVEAELLPKMWNTLRVRAVGSEALVYLNGGHLFTVETAAFSTAGKIGLWTKADSVIWFDDLIFTDLDSRRESDSQ